MANPYRGEATLTLPEGRYTLRLSLNALANLEHELEAADLAALADQLLGGHLTARQLESVLCQALIAGGDVGPLEADDVLARAGAPLVLGAAYLALMRATFGAS